MEFKDFITDPQALVGKTILFESGHSYSTYRNRYILKIVKVTKTGFRIATMPDLLFDLRDGYQKGLNARSDMSRISKCKLLTEEEEKDLRDQWKIKKETVALREEMEIKLKSMTLEQLKLMEKI